LSLVVPLLLAGCILPNALLLLPMEGVDDMGIGATSRVCLFLC